MNNSKLTVVGIIFNALSIISLVTAFIFMFMGYDVVVFFAFLFCVIFGEMAICQKEGDHE